MSRAAADDATPGVEGARSSPLGATRPGSHAPLIRSRGRNKANRVTPKRLGGSCCRPMFRRRLEAQQAPQESAHAEPEDPHFRYRDHDDQ